MSRRVRCTASASRIDHESAAHVDSWRRLGIDTEERAVRAPFVRDRARAQYPGWEASSAAGGDGILRRIEGPAATADNRWTVNRDGYEAPTTQALLHGYWSSIREQDQLQALQKINQMALEQLPIFILFTTADHTSPSAPASKPWTIPAAKAAAPPTAPTPATPTSGTWRKEDYRQPIRTPPRLR